MLAGSGPTDPYMGRVVRIPGSITGNFHIEPMGYLPNVAGKTYRATINGFAPVSPDTQAVAVWAAMNSRGERIFSPECGWFSL